MNVDRVVNYIVKWLNKCCNDPKLNGFVVGISGGIDSAVTSVLCAKTQKPTLVVSMPILQTKSEISCTISHINWLTNRFKNVEKLSINLDYVFDIFKNTVSKHINDNYLLAMANSRSRIRMTVLYALSTSTNRLVVGTGNKVEDFGIGFYTKYGDGGVDISPIASLMKSQIYKIAKNMGISEDILNASPTDGLWDDNRCDEKQIGATYDELEWAMKFFSKNKDCLSLTKRQKDVLNIYKHLREKNLHKMRPIPICDIPKKLL